MQAKSLPEVTHPFYGILVGQSLSNPSAGLGLLGQKFACLLDQKEGSVSV